MSTRWQPPEWAKLPTASRQPQLDIFQDGVKTRTIELSGRRSLVLGRQAELVDLLVADETVSRQHVAVVNSSSAPFIIDLKSAQGTFVAGDDVSPKAALGTQVKPAEAVQLEESQTVRLGGCKSVLRFSGLVEAEEVKWQV